MNAPADGVVEAVLVGAGDQVENGAELLVFGVVEETIEG
jgi:biotin carboxyl carrier protein